MLEWILLLEFIIFCPTFSVTGVILLLFFFLLSDFDFSGVSSLLLSSVLPFLKHKLDHFIIFRSFSL